MALTKVQTAGIATDAVATAHLADNAVTASEIAANAVTTAKINNDAVTADKLANTSVTAGSYGSATAIPAITVDAQGRVTAASTNTVNTTTNLATTTASGSVTVTSSTGNNATISEATGSAAGVMSVAHHDKLDGIEASATADQSNAEIRAAVEAATDSNVFTDADHSKLNGIEASATADQTGSEILSLLASNNIGASHIANGQVTTAKLAADAIDGTRIADDSINSEHYIDGSIDTAHYAAGSVGSTALADNAVTTTRINDDAVTSAKIAANAITANEIAANAVGESELATDSVAEDILKISNSGSNGQALTKQSGATGGLTWATISADGGNAATVDGIDSSSFLRSDAADSASGDITFDGGSGAVTIANNSDIRLENGNWTGDSATKIQHHDNALYVVGGTNGVRIRSYNGSRQIEMNNDGHFRPANNNIQDLGSSSVRWRNIYTNDLNLSNEGSSNDVDGTWGNYTIQEGEDELFLLNRRNGKKYKFNLTEVS